MLHLSMHNMAAYFSTVFQLKIFLVVVTWQWVMCVFFSESELLYPEGTISPSGGIAADILCKGRDYLVSSGILVWL